jgi:Flp pilus assembly pilin Flp
MKPDSVVRSFWVFLRRFRDEESGQDLAEYCLLTALVTLVAAAIYVQASGGIQAIWNGANTSLAVGNTSSGAATAGAGVGSTHP